MIAFTLAIFATAIATSISAIALDAKHSAGPRRKGNQS